MELEITWKRAIRAWWSYLWRNLIAIVVAGIMGAILGFICGFVLGFLGLGPGTVKLIVVPIGAILGLAISVIPLKMILGKDFGEFRLVLLAKDPLAEQPRVAGGAEWTQSSPPTLPDGQSDRQA